MIMLFYFFRKESSVAGGRATNANDVEPELTEFQATKEV
jgi:hypothetical protein